MTGLQSTDTDDGVVLNGNNFNVVMEEKSRASEHQSSAKAFIV
jgi:hypothetical protein